MIGRRVGEGEVVGEGQEGYGAGLGRVYGSYSTVYEVL